MQHNFSVFEISSPFRETTDLQWLRWSKYKWNLSSTVGPCKSLETICTRCWIWSSLTWFSSLHQTWYGAVRPLCAKAVHRGQHAILPSHSRLLGSSIHHCYLWQGHTAGNTGSKGPKVNSFRVRQAAGDIQYCNCDMETTAGVVNSLWPDLIHFYFLGNFNLSLGATSNGWCDTELKDNIRDPLYNITILLLYIRHVFCLTYW